MNTSETSSTPSVLKAACTVSAAALMLGVSQAATVGLHFQPDWTTSAPQYTGFQVTATAFGVPAASWQNLTPLPTGYSNPDNPGPYTLSETISTTTTTNGLHALPNGTLSLTWSATAANTSGFGDASNGGSYGGNHPHRGEQEVLYGFLRDDAFIYTSPNSQIPYSVQITGLKSLFTNTPYVIELIATTDSGTAFTNAIVTAASGTQKLTYTATRASLGILGGYSSVSTPISDDALTISGAPALKDGSTNDLASTIAGIILTDKPVITFAATPPAGPVTNGGPVSLAVTAIGVPPLSYQWRFNGQPISGATSASYTVANLSPATAGFYDVIVANAYGSATNPPVPVSADILLAPQGGLLADSKTQGTPHAAWNNGATWAATSGTHSGVVSFNADQANAITIPGEADLTGDTTGTISLWVKSSGADTAYGFHGDVLIEQGRGAFRLVEEDANQSDAGSISVQAGDAHFSSNATISDGNWHQAVLTYDQSGNGNVTLYVDGVLDTQTTVDAWSWQTGVPFNLGWINDSYWELFNGQLDDVRIYSRMLTDSEVSQLYTSGAVIDPTTLQLRLDFGTAPASGLALFWNNGGGLQSATTPGGPYTSVANTSSPYGFLQPAAPVDFYRTKQ